jgi:hypothetical protein
VADPAAWYEANAAAVSAQYQEVSARAVHGRLLDLLPSPLTPDRHAQEAGRGGSRNADIDSGLVAPLGGLICGYICRLPQPLFRSESIILNNYFCLHKNTRYLM